MARYQIVVEGTAEWLLGTALEDFEVRTVAGGRSCLVGEVVDQAHLQAVLQRLGSFNVTIVDLHRLD